MLNVWLYVLFFSQAKLCWHHLSGRETGVQESSWQRNRKSGRPTHPDQETTTSRPESDNISSAGFINIYRIIIISQQEVTGISETYEKKKKLKSIIFLQRRRKVVKRSLENLIPTCHSMFCAELKRLFSSISSPNSTTSKWWKKRCKLEHVKWISASIFMNVFFVR